MHTLTITPAAFLAVFKICKVFENRLAFNLQYKFEKKVNTCAAFTNAIDPCRPCHCVSNCKYICIVCFFPKTVNCLLLEGKDCSHEMAGFMLSKFFPLWQRNI